MKRSGFSNLEITGLREDLYIGQGERGLTIAKPDWKGFKRGVNYLETAYIVNF
jgi:hypothetical protein